MQNYRQYRHIGIADDISRQFKYIDPSLMRDVTCVGQGCFR